MPLSQAVSFLYNSQPIGISVERANLRGPLVLRTLQTWKIKDKLNRLKVLTVTVFKSDVDRNNIFLERDVFVPVFNFTGIITGLVDVNDSILKIVMTEEAWHFTRRLYKIEDSLKEYNLVLVKPASLPNMLEDLIGSANADMPILNTTEISGLVSLWRLNSTPNDDKGSNNGTWIGTPAYIDGIFHNDKQANFDGTTGIDFTSASLDTVSFTWALWITPNDPIGVAQGIIHTFNTPNRVRIFLNTLNVIEFDAFTAAQSEIGNLQSDKVTKGKRIHIIASYDDPTKTMKLYQNGILKAIAANLTNPVINPTASKELAGIVGGRINAYIDDVRAYNRAITDKEAEKLFLQTQSRIDTIIQRVDWKLGEGDSLDIPNLVALLKFDDDLLDSKGTNNGTVTGVETYVSGVYAKAGDFGSGKIDFVTLANESNFDFNITNVFSVSFFIKPDSTGITFPGIINKSNEPTTTIGWGITGSQTNQALFFNIHNGTTNYEVLTANGTLLNGVYSHVVVTYDGTSNRNGMKIYINGFLSATGSALAITGSILNNLSVVVGAKSDGDAKFKGEIDDVRIYNKELSQVEVARLSDAKDSFIDKIRSDEVPATTDIDFNIKWKSYYEVFRQIALNSVNDVYFENNRVLFGTKGKTFILDRDDKIYEKLSTKIDLDSYGDIVHVVGAEVGGTNVHANAQAPETDLLYNYERVVSNNNLKDQAAVDGVVDRVLDEYNSINPDVKIGVTNEIIQKYNMISGDIIKIIGNTETQTVKGFFRLIEVVSASTKSIIKLQFSKTGRFIPRISDSLDILEAALIKIHDVELNS